MPTNKQKLEISAKWLLFVCLLLATAISGCDKTTVDATRGQPSACELHHVEMEKKKVQIIYGMIGETSYSRSFHAASTNFFPHAQEYVAGGCMLYKTKWSFIYFCPSCEKARLKWQVEVGDELWKQFTNSLAQEEMTNNLSR